MVTAFQMVVAYRMQYLWYETTIPRAWCPVSNGGVGWQYRLAVWSGTTISNCDFEGQYPMGILRESARCMGGIICVPICNVFEPLFGVGARGRSATEA